MKFTDQSNLAFCRKLACAPVEDVSIAHSPLANFASAWFVRPA